MKKHMYRIITSIAVCTMLAAVLSYSRAIAENPGEIQEDNICTLDTADIGAFEEATFSSVALTDVDDTEVLRCSYGSCRISPDCPTDHPAGPFFCRMGCCTPL